MFFIYQNRSDKSVVIDTRPLRQMIKETGITAWEMINSFKDIDHAVFNANKLARSSGFRSATNNTPFRSDRYSVSKIQNRRTHPRLGKKHAGETKLQMSLKKRGELNPTWGMKFSQKTREQMRASRYKALAERGHPMKGVKKDLEYRAKRFAGHQKTTRAIKGAWKWAFNVYTGEEKLFPAGELPEGWMHGRPSTSGTCAYRWGTA